MDASPSSSSSSSPETHKAETLTSFVRGPLAASISRVSSHSRSIPSGKDFHFYNNFDAFKSPANSLTAKSKNLLQTAASSQLLPKSSPELPDDLDDALDWVVDRNDVFLEKHGVAVDEFSAARKEAEAEANGGSITKMESDGFQIVHGKNKKKKKNGKGGDSVELSASEVKVAERDKKTAGPRAKVPFHMPHIPRPQDEYNILVNNKNVPFEHVWLQRSEDESCVVHPLENLSVSHFIGEDIGERAPTQPLLLEDTPFKLVESVNDLKDLALKLCDANEFAIDLEHNQYRSFQGLTCLMQISTRTEDFVVDTLKLRIHIGPHLREVFKDPSKRKVMHGADRDILWLERDFGIYVCNLFDTGQASRVLELERNSLEFLLHHYCDVTANKEYQNADWRLRPLPDEMIKYAREDTHYLLYIYDIMRNQLLSKSNTESDSALMEVYMRSCNICMQLYEKELLTDTSYLHIYGLREADFNSEQLAVVAGLCEWRDSVARAEDESTGYILPNRVLLEIARQLPLTSWKLRRVVKSKHFFLERYLGTVVSIIRSSIKNAPAFECVSEQLRKERVEMVAELNGRTICVDSESLQAVDNGGGETTQILQVDSTSSPAVKSTSANLDASVVNEPGIFENNCGKTSSNNFPVEKLPSKSSSHCFSTGLCDIIAMADNGERGNESKSLKSTKAVNVASVQKLRKPSGAFGALLGSSKKKPYADPRKKHVEEEKAEKKLKQIKSSVSLPFHSFSGLSLKNEKVQDTQAIMSDHIEHQQHDIDVPNTTNELEEVIMVENDWSDSESLRESSVAGDNVKHSENGAVNRIPALNADVKDEDVSLADLSFGFEECSNHINKSKKSAAGMCNRQSLDPNNSIQLQPFDYAAARKQMNSTGEEEAAPGLKNTLKKSMGSAGSSKGPADAVKREAQGTDFQQPRRRQAFPPSGNRSATFK